MNGFHVESVHSIPVFAPIVIGKISADRIPSKVPETCVFEGLMGYAPDETFGEARQDLEGCVARVASTDPWLREHPPAVEWLALNKEGAQVDALPALKKGRRTAPLVFQRSAAAASAASARLRTG